MPFARIQSAQPDGLDARIVDIEIDLSRGLHSFSIVGLAGRAVDEARDRVGAALKNSGFTSPKHTNQKAVISLAPADLRKEGPLFDVGIALSYLLATNEISFHPKGKLFLGELALDGTLRPVKGVLVIARAARAAGFSELFVPKQNAREASLIEEISVFGASSLKEIVGHLDGQQPVQYRIARTPPLPFSKTKPSATVDFSDIAGQELPKRALEIAVAGKHNILLYGPPGTGKTMLAEAAAGICPVLTFSEALETTAIHSVAGTLKEELIRTAPLRRPHHASSVQAIIGGGVIPKPGEITLAHNGILFLDEFPEFDKDVIDSLREPLEERRIAISRTKGSCVFPASFMLVAAMNPCACGFFRSREKRCTCSAISLTRYMERISGPIADRIDLWCEVSSIRPESFDGAKKEESSFAIRERIVKARLRQKERYQKLKIGNDAAQAGTNAEIPSKHIKEAISLGPHVVQELRRAAAQLHLSTRTYYKIIRITRTIADLEGEDIVRKEHLLEALEYRPKEENR